jgi:hypothetical protein
MVKKVKKVINFGSAMDLKDKMTDQKRHTNFKFCEIIKGII